MNISTLVKYKNLQLDYKIYNETGKKVYHLNEHRRGYRYKIKWDKNTTIGFPYTYNEKRGLYYPDFYLPEYDIWVETKGQRYIREGDEARRAAVGKEVILLITNNFKTELPAFISNILSRQKLF